VKLLTHVLSLMDTRFCWGTSSTLSEPERLGATVKELGIQAT
jgi:hypothetical protein